MNTKGGINIEQVTLFVNKRMTETNGFSYPLFDWKFSQKVLTKLQSKNIIYKTSDKMIFSNAKSMNNC